MRAPPQRLFQAQAGPLRPRPSARCASRLRGAVGRRGGDRRRLVVRLQRLVVAVRQLERMAELEIWRRIVGRQPLRELRDLRARKATMSPVDPSTRMSRRRAGTSSGCADQPLLQRLDRFVVVALSHERLRPRGRTRAYAPDASRENGERERQSIREPRTRARDGRGRHDPGMMPRETTGVTRDRHGVCVRAVATCRPFS